MPCLFDGPAAVAGEPSRHTPRLSAPIRIANGNTRASRATGVAVDALSLLTQQKNTASAMETDAVNLEDYKCLVLQDALVEGHNVVACHLAGVARSTYVGDSLVGECVDVGLGDTQVR